ncbi:hypothetical protein [Flavobacterium sp.]|uniref:hypothetical protein n=1 Tax=Flavobacterium sp. TaxID=239 RepID=UPI0037524EF3
MNKKIVHQGQSFLDKVLENTGSIENAFEMALLNGISITDDLAIGSELICSPVSNKVVAELFNEFKKPATGLTPAQVAEIQNLGIGSMRIGSTFIVR